MRTYNALNMQPSEWSSKQATTTSVWGRKNTPPIASGIQTEQIIGDYLVWAMWPFSSLSSPGSQHFFSGQVIRLDF